MWSSSTSQAARSARLNVLLGNQKPSSSSSSNGDQPSTKNPRYIPPADGRCLINRLPPEVLAHAFEMGTRAERQEEEKEVEEIVERFGGTVSSRTIQEDDGDEDYEDVDEDEEDEDEDMWSEDGTRREQPTNGESSLEDDESVADRASFPVLVSHVCQHWRRVALETPQLWTHIGVDETSNIEEVAEWISRSKACPLDIDIDIDDGGSDDDYDAEKTTLSRALSLQLLALGGELDSEQKECFNPVSILFDSLRLLVPHMKRWQKFVLQTTSFPAMLAAVFQIGIHDRENASSPLLEVLWLACTDEFVDISIYKAMISQYGEQAFRLFGCHVPRLRDVSLWGVPIAYEMLIPSPISQVPSSTSSSIDLRELEFAYMPWTELRPTYSQLSAILRGAPNLQRLKISDAGFAKETPGEIVEPIRLPALRHLELSDPAQIEEAMELIRFLHAPALETLYLAFESEDYTEAVRLLATQPMVADADARMVIVPGSVPEGGEILLASVRELKLAGLMCNEDAMTLLYRAAHRVKKLFLNMNNLTLESATKLCLPWDTAILLEDDMSPHEAWQANNGVPFGPNDLGQIGQVTAAATASTTPTTNGPGAGASTSGDRSSLSAKENIPLPELTELTVSGMSGMDLVALVLMRKEMRVPLKTLRIDRRDEGEEEITDEIWAFLKKAIGRVEWVKVDTEDSDDDGNSDDEDDGMSIDGFELDVDEDDEEEGDEEDFIDEDADEHMHVPDDLLLHDALLGGLDDAEFQGDEDPWEDVDGVD